MPSVLEVSRPRVQAALESLRGGRPILVYDADGREEETDLVLASQHVTPAGIQRLRREAGGLICSTLPPEFHQGIGLPYLSDVLHEARRLHPLLGRLVAGQIPYEKRGSKSSFAVSINHRETFTGVTDKDRALTITRLAAVVKEFAKLGADRTAERFADEFRSPGHVFLLNAHPRRLDGRRGHTELTTVLAELAGLAPSATICEMMNGPSGRALPKADAIKYAAENDLVFLEGTEVITAWQQMVRAASA